MAIVYDYKDISERYEQLSGGWLPKEPVLKDKVALNAAYGPVASSDVARRVQQIVDRLKVNGRPFQQLCNDVFDRYKRFAMVWAVFDDYLDPITGLSFDRVAVDHELTLLEKQHGLNDERDRFRFRLEFVNWIYSQPDNSQWDSNPKFKIFFEEVTASMMLPNSLMLPKLLPMTS